MLVSLIAAVVAALCYGVASVMQAVAVREASNRTVGGAHEGTAAGVDPGLLPRMLHQWRFVASVVIAALPWRVIGVSLSWREWAAVIGVVAGVGLLGSSAGAEGAHQAGAVFKIA